MSRNPSAILCLLAVMAGVPATMAEVSQLWGNAGEKWNPAGRLPDFSFAGYRRGEAPLPNVPAVASVKDFGAVGDGGADDTAAFQRAVKEARPGAIEIPPGRYLISDIIEIRRPGIVFRGAGPDKTTIYIGKTLQEVRPNMGATTSGQPTSNYSWSGGFFWVQGSFQSTELARIVEPAKRGGNTLRISSAQGLKAGQFIEVVQQDAPDNSLAASLYGGQPGTTSKLNGRTRASITAKIVRIDGDRITIDRTLRFDVDAKWKPRVLRFEPTVSEVGIELLRFEFPVTPYKGHFTEWGHNPIAISGAADCWVRNIVIDHCDSGLFPGGRFCTFADIAFNSARPADKTGCTGHHGIYIGGDDNLFTRFRFNTRFVHDITVSHCAGNVISAGSGVDLCFDHHKRTPYANLFTDIDLGEGTRMWRCGGGADLGRHSAAYETFWGIRARRPQGWPFANFGPDLMNLVGLRTEQPSVTSPDGKWFEAIDPDTLTPENLHEAQVKRRLGR